MANNKLWITKANAKKLTEKDVIDNVAHINMVNDKGVTPLMEAVRYTKDGVLVQTLIDYDADVNAQDNSGYCPIMLSKERDVILTLGNSGVDFHVTDNIDGSTPLMHVLKAKGSAVVVDLLIDYGSDVNAVNKNKSTPLTIAIEQKLSPDVIQLLLDAGADIDYQKGTVHSPIERALSVNANIAVFKVLLAECAEITTECIERNNFSNAKTEKLFEEYLPMEERKATKEKKAQEKAKKSDKEKEDKKLKISESPKIKKCWLTKKLAKSITLEKLQKFIDDGVDVNAEIDDSDSGITVLMELLDKHNGEDLLKIIKALLKAGATLNNCSEDSGYTELMYAISSLRSLEIVKFLIDSGADVNLSGGQGEDALSLLNFSTVANGSKEFKKKYELCTKYTKALVKAGANPNAILTWREPFTGNTNSARVFELLCFANRMPIESFKILLDAGAEVNDKDGTSKCLSQSIHSSVSMNPELCLLLLEYGAKPDAEFFNNLVYHSNPEGHSPKETKLILKGCANIQKSLARNNLGL